MNENLRGRMLKRRNLRGLIRLHESDVILLEIGSMPNRLWALGSVRVPSVELVMDAYIVAVQPTHSVDRFGTITRFCMCCN